MRPKIVALFAVPVLALVGCSAAAETAPDPAETASVSEAPSASAQTETADKRIVGENPYDPDTGISPEEYGFTAYLSGQAMGIEVELPTESEAVEALHDYCDEGDPFNFTDENDLNEKLAKVADSQSCDQIANQR